MAAASLALLAYSTTSALAVNIPAGDLVGQLPGWPVIKDQATQVETVRPGVTYSAVDLLTNNGLLRLYELDADLTAPGVNLSNVLSHNSVVSTGETVTSMANRTGALAGINGDYFAIHESGIPLNWTIQNGNLIRSGNQWAVFSVNANHQVNIGKYDWAGSVKVMENGLSFPLEAVNLPLMDHKIIAVTQSMGSVMAAKDATLVYLQPAADKYVVRSVMHGQSTVQPVNGTDVVLAGEGVAASWLDQYAPVGKHVILNYSSQPDWHNLKLAIGGGPILLQNGYPYNDPHAPASFEGNQPYPVSGVGISQDGKRLTLVTVDGHEGRPAKGLTRSQFAWYFQTIGAWNAMAFDSGGSAEMAVRHPGDSWTSIVNHPSDGHERPVADGLFIYG
jgi:hypothetical protein